RDVSAAEEAASARGPLADAWEWADARFRADQTARVTRPLELDGLDDDIVLTLLDEPPDYVQPLLEQVAGSTPLQDAAAPVLSLPRRSVRTTRKLAALQEEEALRFVYETHEDEITAVIRATGGDPPLSDDAHLTLAPGNPGGGETASTGLP